MCGASKNIRISDFYMGEIEKPAKTTMKHLIFSW